MQVLKTSRSLFEIANGLDEAICITTNGVVKRNFAAVMGAGVAKQCAELFPSVPLMLGSLIASAGNTVHYLGVHSMVNKYGNTVNYCIFSFPTKNHWRSKSDIRLIKKSAYEMVVEANNRALKKIYLPKVGCLNGGLDWDAEVYPAIKDILDDRFIAIIRE